MVITKESHLDHGLTSAHIALILKLFGDQQGFLMETIDIPEGLSELDCGIVGPSVGDYPIEEKSVYYKRRGDRVGESRMLKFYENSEPKKTRKLTVIMGLNKEETMTILYTAYGGPIAPREPWDPVLVVDSPEHKASLEFWSKHALLG